jgi:hypothetical protein
MEAATNWAFQYGAYKARGAVDIEKRYYAKRFAE